MRRRSQMTTNMAGAGQQSAAALEESLKVLEGLRNDVKAKTEEILRK